MNADERKSPPWRILLVIVLALGVGTISQTLYSQAQRDEDNSASISRDVDNSQNIDALRERYEQSQQELNDLIDRILQADTPEEINAALQEFSEQNPTAPPITLPPMATAPRTSSAPTTARPAPTTGAPGGTAAPAPPTRVTTPPAPPAQTSSPAAPSTTIPPILQLPGDDCLLNLLNICIG